MASTAKALARVVADLKSGTTVTPQGLAVPEMADLAERLVDNPVVVDASNIYATIPDRKEIRLYEDHPCIAAPWPEFVIGYRNEHGNVIVVHCTVIESDILWTPAEPVDGVKWVLTGNFYIGGHDGTGQPFPTLGPMHNVTIAVRDDGAPADIHWRHLVPKYPMQYWDNATVVLLSALNFLNAVNVEAVEVDLPARERKRVARTGVKVHEIHVFPAGRRRAAGDRGEPIGTGASPVRGHFAHYGEQYGRGLLFGKHSGKFWIPARVDVPDAPSYKLVP